MTGTNTHVVGRTTVGFLSAGVCQSARVDARGVDTGLVLRTVVIVDAFQSDTVELTVLARLWWTFARSFVVYRDTFGVLSARRGIFAWVFAEVVYASGGGRTVGVGEAVAGFTATANRRISY